MSKKTVLIIENDEAILDPLQGELETRGFRVYSARNAAEARGLAELHWAKFEVAVLDMDLDDPNERNTTGADIAIEFRKKQKSFPPESLIYSIVGDNTDYYRLALDLGAAAYMLKAVHTLLDVVRQVRVLALRRALNGENPEVASAVAQIAVHSRNKSEAIQTFCWRVLKPEFESCLGVDFVILLTEGNTTRNCADNAGLPAGTDPFYHTLQALAHGKGNITEPFILEAGKLGTTPDPETARLYEKLNLAAFLPLSLSNDLKLSIGILRKDIDGAGSAEEARSVCSLLAQYLRPTVLENVLNIWSQWTELRATRTSTAKLCLSVGQEINAGLDTEDLLQLEDLANDLNDTGQYLAQLDSRNFQEGTDVILVRDLVAEAWKFVTQAEDTFEIRLEVQGDCSVNVQRSDLEIVFSRLLQWFVYRSKAMPLDVKPDIKINCEATDSGATITFEDNSHRLPKRLREDLFAPFTQAISTPFAEIDGAGKSANGASPDKSERSHLNTGRYLPLYLTKMLVEGRYHGLLEDHSDEITERSYGHRILMQFPGNQAG